MPGAVAALAVAGAFFAVLAAQSGESLEDEVEDRAESIGREFETDDHEDAGAVARNLAILLAVASVGAAATQYAVPRAREIQVQGPILCVTVVLGIVASWYMFDAGHSGAKLVWEDPGNFVVGDGSGDGDHDDD